MQIRDQRLYRGAHGTFEAYCKDRWDFGRAHACRLIGACETMGVLSPIGDKLSALPANESQMRPLLQFPPEDRAEVWQDVLKRLNGNPITGRDVEREVRWSVRDGTRGPYKRRRRAINKVRREDNQRREEEHKVRLASEIVKPYRYPRGFAAELKRIPEEPGKYPVRWHTYCDYKSKCAEAGEPETVDGLRDLVVGVLEKREAAKAPTYPNCDVPGDDDQRHVVEDDHEDFRHIPLAANLKWLSDIVLDKIRRWPPDCRLELARTLLLLLKEVFPEDSSEFTADIDSVESHIVEAGDRLDEEAA